MFGYPIALELTGRKAVVVGSKSVAMGKVEGLLAAGATVRVVAEGPEGRLGGLAADPRVRVIRRPFRPSDLDGAFLCVASSPDPAERAAIHEAGRRRGVLMNVVDDVGRCDFAAPAVVRRGDLAIAVSTGGASPALARRLREELSERFGPEWGALLDVLRGVRAETRRALPDIGERSRRWAEALDLEEAADLVRRGQRGELRTRLLRRLAGNGAA